MFELAKIVCPADFSKRSPESAWYAGALACHFRSELHLIHVVEPRAAWSGPEMGAPMIDDLIDMQCEDARKCLAGLLPELSNNVKRVVLEGDAAFEIVEYAKRENVGLIVMPTHGYGPFRRFILGSVTAKVLHDVHCPVLTGVHMDRPPLERGFGVSRIVCSVDLGPDSERVLGWADQFAKAFGSRLTAISVASPDDSQLERLRSAVGANCETLVDSGADIAKSVCSMAEGLEANLTIIGRGGFGKSIGRLRANAYAIIRQSHCPVISV